MTTRKPTAPSLAGTDFVKGGVVLALVLLTLLVCWFAPQPKAGGEAGVVMDLPYQVGDLLAFSEDVSAAELYLLPKDTTFARKTYGSPTADRNDRILCSIILSGKEKRSIHRPERCLPAQGWRIQGSREITVPLASGRSLGVTALLLGKTLNLADGRSIPFRCYYLYWFVGKGLSTPYTFERILLTNWELLVHRTNQRWAYVIVSANITQDLRPDGVGPEQTLENLKTFIHDSVPFYMKSEMPPGSSVTSK